MIMLPLSLLHGKKGEYYVVISGESAKVSLIIDRVIN